jgi:predicted SAM-dependent methyltransferase
MRVFKSKPKNIAYFFYRIVSPVIEVDKVWTGITGYGWYIRDLIRYQSKDKKAKLIGMNMFPILNEKVQLTPFDAQYFFQQLWVFENVLKRKPKSHVDVASTYELSGYLSKIVKTKFVDIRPIKTNLKNLEIINGDILNLPFKDKSIESLSCLHVAEHIGLGRYGDPIDPDGTKKACAQLSKKLAINGYLYFSLPIGKDRICFNAHRVHSPQTILDYFPELKLLSFNIVDDDGNYLENVDYKKYKNNNYSCGMFLFTKPA